MLIVKGVAVAVSVVAVASLAFAQDLRVPEVVKAEPALDWNARFAGKEGWLGGDGVYSIRIGPARVLWLFGDTLLGTVKDGGRPGAVMVNNTVGIQEKTDGAIRFVAGKRGTGKPAAIFTPADGKGWFWPQAPVMVGQRLLVFLPQIAKTTDPGVFGFRSIGQWLAIVDNPQEEPDKWRVKQHKLPFADFQSGKERSWGSAVLEHDGHLYIYGYLESGKELNRRRLTVARAPRDQVSDFKSWRFRAAAGWSARPEDAAPLADGLATEFSVTRSPERGYVLVYTENGLGARIVARFSATPDGPWSRPVTLYQCPEMAKDKGVFCYAARAQPWAAEKNTLLVSYCVNTWKFERLFQDETVYRPKFVRVELKP